MWIWPIIAIILVLLGIVIIVLVSRFDTKIITRLKQENTLNHKVSTLLFDYLSNIKTLITLRFLSPTENNIDHAVSEMYPYFNRRIQRNERKRFTIDTILQAILISVVV